METLSKTEKKNTYLGLSAVLIWSFAALAAVGLTAIPPFELMVFIFGIAFLVVIARYLKADDKKNFLNFSKMDLTIASTTLVINHLCYYLAFRYAPAAEVDLINYLWPTMLILLSSLLPNEKLCLSYLFAAAVCFWGLYILLCPDFSKGVPEEYLIGYLFAFGAALSWTLYSLYTRYHHKNSPNCISFACGVSALFSLAVHLLFEDFVLPNGSEWAIIVLLGILEVGLAYYFWDRALKKGSVKILSLGSYSIPVLSVLILVCFGAAEFKYRMIIATFTISVSPLIPLMKRKLEVSSLVKRAEQPNPLKSYS